MENKINLMMSDFYNTFSRIEEFSLKQNIKCLTMNEFHVIESIGNNRLLMNEVADILRVSMGTATVSVNKLVRKKFINRERDEEDRRKVYVTLTKKGLIALNNHNSFHLNTIKSITKDLSNREIELFLSTFSKLQLNLLETSVSSQPKALKYYDENEKVRITEISGTRGLQEFFYKKGISQGKMAKILKKEQDNILIELNDKLIDIDIKDSKYLFAIPFVK